MYWSETRLRSLYDTRTPAFEFRAFADLARSWIGRLCDSCTCRKAQVLQYYSGPHHKMDLNFFHLELVSNHSDPFCYHWNYCIHHSKPLQNGSWAFTRVQYTINHRSILATVWSCPFTRVWTAGIHSPRKKSNDNRSVRSLFLLCTLLQRSKSPFYY